MRVTSPVAPGWFVESSPRSSASAIAAAAGGEDHGRGVERVLADARAPAVLGRLERGERALREERDAAGLGRLAQRGRDRVARAVADLEQALRATRRRSGRAGSRRSPS